MPVFQAGPSMTLNWPLRITRRTSKVVCAPSAAWMSIGSGHLDAAAAHVEALVVVVVQQRLHRAAKALHLVAAEGVDIGRQVEVLPQHQPLRRRQGDRALELDLRLMVTVSDR